jgi:hypothetical protein
MFGQSKPVVLQSYGNRRKRGRPPRWLVLLLSGMALGALAVVVVQERYLPPRLSASESTQLRKSYEDTNAERLRLQQALGDASQKLGTALDAQKTLAADLTASRSTAERLQGDLSTVVAALPPDPRGSSVEVRAGRFTSKGGMLVYDVVLTRERANAKPMAGVLQLTVAGQPARGTETTVALKPVTVALGSHEIVRGSQPLPEGFRPRETTVRVLDRVAGTPLGMRVMLVR